jgi:hypothetical protein
VDSIQEQLVMSASRADVLEPPLAGKVPRHAATGTVTGTVDVIVGIVINTSTHAHPSFSTEAPRALTAASSSSLGSVDQCDAHILRGDAILGNLQSKKTLIMLIPI